MIKATKRFVSKAEREFAIAKAGGDLDALLDRVSITNLETLRDAALEFGKLAVYSATSDALARRPKSIWNGTDIVTHTTLDGLPTNDLDVTSHDDDCPGCAI